MQLIYWLIAVLLSAGAAFWVYGTDKKRAVPHPWLTSLLRGLVVFFTLVLVLVPTLLITKNSIEKPVIVLLQDNTKSVSVALGADSAQYRKNVEGLMQRLGDKYKVVQWGFGSGIQTDSIFDFKQSATDIAAALTNVQEYYGMQNLGAVILASDGRFNQGINPVYQQLALHSPVYTVAIGDSAVQKDMRITQVYANKVVTLNSSFELRADIVARLCKGYNNAVVLKDGDNRLNSSALEVNSEHFDRSVSFTIKADKAGLHHYILTVPVAEGEKNVQNNRKDIFVEVVDEKRNILIASASPHPDVNAIKEALAGLQNYSVTICTPETFPANLAPYNVIILHGLPSVRNDISAQLLAAKKPTWYILTTQTNVPAFNNLRALTNTNVMPAPLHDVLGAYNTSFNTFTLPQQIQSVTDKMPPLGVASGNITTLPSASNLFTQRAGLGNVQAPLWFLQQGVAPMALLAGDGIWRWRLYEFKNFNTHNVVDECIRQTVSFLSVNSNEKPFSVGLSKYVWRDQEPISLRAYLVNANNEQINTPDATLTITDSAGRKHDYSFERSGNTYILNIGIWAGGNYTYTARTTYNGKAYTTGGSFAVETMPVELMEQGADYPLLFALSQKYNGAFVPASAVGVLYDSITRNEHIKPLIQVNTESVPFVDRKWYFFLIMLIAVTEWLLRKYWLAQ